MVEDQRKAVFIRLDPKLHARIKVYCAQQNMTMQDFFAMACQVYMNYSVLLIGKENDSIAFLFKGDDKEQIVGILKDLKELFDGSKEKARPEDH